MKSDSWQTRDRFLELRSQWLTLIGEHLQDPQGQRLEYWRIEKADSVIILPLHNQQLLLPSPTFRPGLGTATLDFPGGRVPSDQSPGAAAPDILRRELGVPIDAIAQLTPLNPQGWAVNSSFSNQKLYGVVAELQSNAEIPPDCLGSSHRADSEGVQSLLQDLHCLQCRSVLLEWWHRS